MPSPLSQPPQQHHGMRSTPATSALGPIASPKRKLPPWPSTACVRSYYYRERATCFRYDVMIPVVYKCSAEPVPGSKDPGVLQMAKGDALHL